MKHECPRNGHFYQKLWPWYLTLTDDLDFGTKKKAFTPRNIYMKYESSITYHSKTMANVKLFVDRQTGQKLYAPDLSMLGHKNAFLTLS